jgi:NADP-dependent 3-hydroxy acid dehydrogenase YdfG
MTQQPQLFVFPESDLKMSSLDAASLFGVKGLVAVITGGGTGIGLMLAKALEHNGAKVYIIGRRLETLQNAAKEAVRPPHFNCRKKSFSSTIRNTATSSLSKAMSPRKKT